MKSLVDWGCLGDPGEMAAALLLLLQSVSNRLWEHSIMQRIGLSVAFNIVILGCWLFCEAAAYWAGCQGLARQAGFARLSNGRCYACATALGGLCWHVLFPRSVVCLSVCLSGCSAARRCYGIPLCWPAQSHAQAAHIASTALHACCGCGLAHICFGQFLEQGGGSRTAAVCRIFAACLVVRLCLGHNCVEAPLLNGVAVVHRGSSGSAAPGAVVTACLPSCCRAVCCCFGGTWAALAT